MPDAAYFDGWYADMAERPAKDALMRRHLRLPPHMLPSGTVPWSGIADICDALRLRRGEVVVDLGCGRGSIGLELAARTGARLVGVDASRVALGVAWRMAAEAEVPASYVLGDLTATGLPSRCADAAVCLDSIQYAPSVERALGEMRRLLRPGGRLVLTGWQVFDGCQGRAPEPLCAVRLERQLREAGFVRVRVVDRPDWQQVERAMWDEAIATDPGGDRALRSLHEEGLRSLPWWDTLRRVLATATAPVEGAGRPISVAELPGTVQPDGAATSFST